MRKVNIRTGFTHAPICGGSEQVMSEGKRHSVNIENNIYRKKLVSGFTLVELMVAAAMLLIILGAMIPQFRAIRESWATTQKSSEIIQNVMVLDDHLSRNLAAAKIITAVSSGSVENGFITFTDNLGISKTYRLSDGYIAFGDTANPQPLAGPASKFKILCYAINDFNTPTTDANSIRLVKIETNLTGSESKTAARAFTTKIFIQTGQTSPSNTNVIDIMVDSAQPNTAIDYIAGDSGCDAVIETSAKGAQGLLCFQNIVGDEEGQIRKGSKISKATLKLWVVNHNGKGSISLYRMYNSWTESSTWSSIGKGVVPGKNCDSSTAVTVSPGNHSPVSVEIDVTQIVQGWVNGSYPNYGFGIINNQNNNFQFAASENTTGKNAHTPKLVLTSAASTDTATFGDKKASMDIAP